MRFSTQTLHLTDKLGIKPALKMLSDLGYSTLDFTLHNPHENFLDGDYVQKAKEIRSYADSLGLSFNQSHAPFGGGFEHYTKKLVPLMPRAFEFSAILGIKTVVVHPLQIGVYYESREKLFDMNMSFYSSLAPYAKDAGVKIGIENMWMHHPVTKFICDDVCADPDEHSRYYDTLNMPEAFTICLDLGHVALCGREPERAIRQIGGDRLGALHVHDVNYVEDLHTLPGAGKINWDNVCRALADIDYLGEITLEADNFYKGFDESLMSDCAAMLFESARNLALKVDNYKKEKNK